MENSLIIQIYREALILNDDPDTEMTTKSFVTLNTSLELSFNEGIEKSNTKWDLHSTSWF